MWVSQVATYLCIVGHEVFLAPKRAMVEEEQPFMMFRVRWSTINHVFLIIKVPRRINKKCESQIREYYF